MLSANARFGFTIGVMLGSIYRRKLKMKMTTSSFHGLSQQATASLMKKDKKFPLLTHLFSMDNERYFKLFITSSLGDRNSSLKTVDSRPCLQSTTIPASFSHLSRLKAHLKAMESLSAIYVPF